MKALAIQPARGSQRAEWRAILAAVSNLKSRIDARACHQACLIGATVAIIVFFVCLGLMYVPGIVISGLMSLSCALFAPIDKDIEQEGGAL